MNSASLQVNGTQQVLQQPFYYFGQKVTSLNIFPNGDFYLNTDFQFQLNISYHVVPFFYQNSRHSMYCFDQVTHLADLNALSYKIHGAPHISTAYAITWSIYDVNSRSTQFQVVLCATTNSSYMIISYAKMYIPSDTNLFYYSDPFNPFNTFQASTTDTNSNAPGQFIFQLNEIQGSCLTAFFFYYI
jgi:hypothetical protein